jgi:hypothetical protein
VAEIAGDALVGAGVFRGALGGDVSGQVGERGVAAVASFLHARHLGLLERVGECQVEVLDLVPVVDEALRHQGLLVLAGQVHVAGRAVLGRFEIAVGVGAEQGQQRDGTGQEADDLTGSHCILLDCIKTTETIGNHRPQRVYQSPIAVIRLQSVLRTARDVRWSRQRSVA